MDLELVLFENANATAVTSNIVEIHGDMKAVFTGELAGAGNVAINLQDCDTAGGYFETVVSMVVPVEAFNTAIALGFPSKHQKYVKAVVTVDPGVTGTMTGYISDEYTVEPSVKPQGVEFIPTID